VAYALCVILISMPYAKMRLTLLCKGHQRCSPAVFAMHVTRDVTAA